MIVGATGNNAPTEQREFSRKCARILYYLFGVFFECRLRCFVKRNGDTGDRILMRAALQPGKTALSILLGRSRTPACAGRSFFTKIIAPRGPRNVLCVVVVTMSAYGNGDACAPPATSPAMCDMSTMRYAPTASATARNFFHSILRG